jgi:hypothetical protein
MTEQETLNEIIRIGAAAGAIVGGLGVSAYLVWTALTGRLGWGRTPNGGWDSALQRLREEMGDDMKALEERLNQRFSEFRQEMRQDLRDLRSEMGGRPRRDS